MLKFDRNTYNATADDPGGPVSRFVHDDQAFLSHNNFEEDKSPLRTLFGLLIAVVVIGIIVSIHSIG